MKMNRRGAARAKSNGINLSYALKPHSWICLCVSVCAGSGVYCLPPTTTAMDGCRTHTHTHTQRQTHTHTHTHTHTEAPFSVFLFSSYESRLIILCKYTPRLGVCGVHVCLIVCVGLDGASGQKLQSGVEVYLCVCPGSVFQPPCDTWCNPWKSKQAVSKHTHTHTHRSTYTHKHGLVFVLCCTLYLRIHLKLFVSMWCKGGSEGIVGHC